MKDLTITQEYLMCAVNEKGLISGFSIERLVCFVASGLLEMQLENCIRLDKKTILVIDELPSDKIHLKPLYDYINQQKPVKIEKVLEAYNYSMTDKRLNELLDSVGASLVKMGIVKVSKAGFFGKKNSYLPEKEAVTHVIDMVKSELLEDVTVTDDVASLVVLLDKGRLMKTYFSDFERKEIKSKLSQIMDSETGKAVKDMVDYIESMIVIMSTVSTASI